MSASDDEHDLAVLSVAYLAVRDQLDALKAELEQAMLFERDEEIEKLMRKVERAERKIARLGRQTRRLCS